MIRLHRISGSLTFKSWKQNWLKHKASKVSHTNEEDSSTRDFSTQLYALSIIELSWRGRARSSDCTTSVSKHLWQNYWVFYLKQRKKKLKINESKISERTMRADVKWRLCHRLWYNQRKQNRGWSFEYIAAYSNLIFGEYKIGKLLKSQRFFWVKIFFEIIKFNSILHTKLLNAIE